MEIHTPKTIDQSSSIMEKINDIQFYVFADCPDDLLKIEFWLGSSNDLQTWALFAIDTNNDDSTDDINPNHLVAWLTAPPKGNAETIGAMLADVYLETLQGKPLGNGLIQSIISSHPFPVYRTVAHYLPSAPEEWLALPAEIVVGFELSEGACLYKSIFEEFKRESFQDVVATLFSTRLHGVFLHYSLLVRELVPLASCEVDWPLARRGKNLPHKRSAKVQGAVPWEQEPNTAVLELYQSVPYDQSSMTPKYWVKPVIRLQVAGFTPEKAIKNWHQISLYLRKCK